MKAIILSEFGEATRLKLKDVDHPKVMAKKDIYMRHSFTGINFADVQLRKRESGSISDIVKSGIIGFEGVGIIEKVGSGVIDGLQVGQRVGYCLGSLGSYAEKRTIHNSLVIAIPDYIDDEKAAASFRKGLMAHTLLFKTFNVYKGSTIMVHSAAGGVGHILSSWAASMGVRVIGTVGSDDKISIAKSMGCDLVLNYKTDNVFDTVFEFTNGKGVNAVYDGIGAKVFADSLKCLGFFGIYVSYGEVSGKILHLHTEEFAQKSLFFTRPVLEHYKSSKAEIIFAANEVFEAVSSGKINLKITRYSLQEIVQAHTDLESCKTTGSLVMSW